MALGLTRRQSDALMYIAGYIQTFGEAPTHREMLAGLGLNSTSASHRLTEGLAERGLIRKLYCADRAIELLQPVTIPRSPTGEPLFYIPVPSAPHSCTGSRRNAARAVPSAPIHDPLTSNPKGYAAGAVGVTDLHSNPNSVGALHDPA